MYNITAKDILSKLIQTRDYNVITQEDKDYINNLISSCIINQFVSQSVYQEVYDALMVCNIIYTNTNNTYPIINDDSYDSIITIMRRCNMKIPVGADLMNLSNISNIINQSNSIENPNLVYVDGKLEIVKQVPEYNQMIFLKDLTTNITPYYKEDFLINPDTTKVERKLKTAQSKYHLCGSLDKCKYVIMNHAQQYGKLDDPSVSIFERDFLHKHIQEGIIDPNNISGIVSLKYDGVSVENEISGYTIINSYTRGDINSNNVSDLTSIFGGTEFIRAKTANLNLGYPFAVKFEYIITHDNMVRLSNDFGKTYVNNRQAVSGILSGLDARLYKDYLTPIPIETSLNMDRIHEIEFMNQYFTSGIDFRYSYIHGNVADILYLVSMFVEEADSLREYMNFLYDGIVFEYTDPNIRHYMGKRDSIPRYSVAIKFNPMERKTTFLYYSFSVGKDGRITPIAYFKPVEFLGGIHNKATCHSYERFKKLNLKPGDRIKLTYVNDVMPYLDRLPEFEQDPNNTNNIIEFPITCPSCGSQLYMTDTQKSVYCTNFKCPERMINRLADMLKKLNIKDFSTETIRALQVYTFKDLYYYDRNKASEILGPVNSLNLFTALEELKTNSNYPDYIWVGSVGFSNIAERTWKLILEQFSIDRLLHREPLETLIAISGIGQATIDTIYKELPYFIEDLYFIFNTFKWTKSEYNVTKKPKAVFTGVRDPEVANKLTSLGYDVSEGGVTKDCQILIVPRLGHVSSKVERAFKLLETAYSKAYNTPKPKITWNNLNIAAGLYPIIMTLDQASVYANQNLIK